jgi:hypothetical protein
MIRLGGQRDGIEPVGEHEEAHGLHAQLPRGGEVLDRHVGLGAVGRDPGHRRPGLAGVLQVRHRAQPRQQQDRDLRRHCFLGGGADQPDIVHRREAVVERRAAQPVAVGHLDDRYAGAIQPGDHRAGHLLVELMSLGMGPVPQRRVGDANVEIV